MVTEETRTEADRQTKPRTRDPQPRPQAGGDGSDRGTTSHATEAAEPPERRQSER